MQIQCIKKKTKGKNFGNVFFSRYDPWGGYIKEISSLSFHFIIINNRQDMQAASVQNRTYKNV